MQRRALLGFALLTLAACGPRERPALPSPPRLTSAVDLIPADLDVVARLELSRMRGVLGDIATRRLARDAVGRASEQASEEPDARLLDTLLAAERVYLAYRPSARLFPLDRVLIAEGRFAPLVAPPPRFGPPRDLGADLRYWDRKPMSGLGRSETARLYAQGERLRAFVSEAEIDAVELALSAPPSPRRLVPPPEGLLSLAARPALLAHLGKGSLRQLLERAKALEATFDLESDRARIEAALVLASSDDAAALRDALPNLLERIPSEWGIAPELGGDQDRVVLRADVGRQALAPLAAWLGSLE